MSIRLGLIGFPLAHSLSPAMHRAALQELGLAGTYELLETPLELLPQRLAEVRQEFRGVNVTVPHKEHVLPFLDDLSPEAAAIGAVNTVVNESGRLVGHNTDAAGFLRGLEEAGIAYRGKRVLILGAGGAARGIAFALKPHAAEIWIQNRTPIRAMALAEEFGLVFVPDFSLEGAVRECDLLINTTSVGLKDPRSSPLPQGLLPQSGVVVDIVYNPPLTKLLQDAQARGLRTLGGLPMLVWQGALAFELWTGQRPEVSGMYRAARDGLGG
ncbi:MAG: shikimate dehydrogenase [Meiothermus sp.]